jgi:hypothetical protein
MLVPHEIKKIFQSQRDRLRNADEPHMMRPKQDRKPLRGIARTLYLGRNAKLSKAEELATSGFVGKVIIPEKKKEKENEEKVKS